MICNFEPRINRSVEIEESVLNVTRKIVESVSPDESFYVLNVDDVLLKLNNWGKKLPRVTPYYAVKCNPDPSFLHILSSLGVSFDCASKNEMEKVLSLGVHPSRIIFANPAKLPSHLKFAADQEVNTVTADGEEELYKIKQLHPTAKILLRIRSDATVCVTNLGMKFGCNSSLEAPGLLRLARKLRLKIAGICFHVGTGCQEPTAYKRAIAKARLLFDLGLSLGFRMRILDIGGGYPGDRNSSIDQIAQNINEAINDYFPESCGVSIIAEPGRYFATSAFTIATYIHGKRVFKEDDTGESVNLFFIPDGIFGSFNALLFDPTSFHPVPLSRKSQTCMMMPSFICGPTSHPLDIITERINFPDLEVGDWILFENMGAYRAASARYFSGFLLPEVYVAYNGSILSTLDNFHVLKEDFINQRRSRQFVLDTRIIYPGVDNPE